MTNFFFIFSFVIQVSSFARLILIGYNTYICNIYEEMNDLKHLRASVATKTSDKSMILGASIILLTNRSRAYSNCMHQKEGTQTNKMFAID